MALPFYKYDITNGKKTREKISINDKKGKLDKLLSVFGVVVEHQHEIDDDKVSEKVELMSINIINDNEKY